MMDTHTISESTPGKKQQALVIGGSIAGLLAAHVLSDHYEQVLVVEREAFSENFDLNSGAPQTYHLHRLLQRGRLILQRLFPGIIDDLLAHGANSVADKKQITRMGHEIVTLSFPDQDMTCSRALLEWEIRQRVKALPNVSFLFNREVIGLEMTADRTGVAGIQVRQRGQPGDQTKLAADLVIDASGYTSKLSRWLQDLGYTLPEPEQVHANIGYSSRYYRMPSGLHTNIGIFISRKTTLESFGVAIQPIENNEWLVLMAGMGGHYPSTDPAEFEQQLAASNINAEVFAPFQDMVALGPPRGYRVPTCVRNHFELTEQWPAGLLVMGDALCNFDPVYGQGMSVAAIEAEILADCLQNPQDHLGITFEKYVLQRMQKAIETAWWLGTLSDLADPRVTYTGPFPLKGVKLLTKYIGLYMRYALFNEKDKLATSQASQTYFAKYLRMTDLINPPQEIFNTTTLEMLLTSGEPSLEQQVFTDFVKTFPQSFDTIFKELIPSPPTH